VKALIADDEPVLARHLRARLGELWPELEVVGMAANGVEALEMIEGLKPDVAFLDIRMPGLSGLEVAQRLAADFPCCIVFVTAYDQHAVEAFERAAVDYVLKPADDARLARTVERLRQALGEPSALERKRLAEAVAEVLGKVSPGNTAQPAWLKWIRASVGDSVRLVPTEDVRYFQSADKYTSGDDRLGRTADPHADQGANRAARPGGHSGRCTAAPS
jgi:DNA-binding LytR/AlgR family response regulator